MSVRSMSADELIKKLNLQPHPEGGYYRETYRASGLIAQAALPTKYSGDRCTGTCIYYLLTPDTFSAMHDVKSDEIFHFYLGDVVEQLLLYPGGEGEVRLLGHDITGGAVPQALVPQGVWQGARLAPGGQWALLGCTVSPGFEFADYREGLRANLQEQWPAYADWIAKLTRN